MLESNMQIYIFQLHKGLIITHKQSYLDMILSEGNMKYINFANKKLRFLELHDTCNDKEDRINVWSKIFNKIDNLLYLKQDPYSIYTNCNCETIIALKIEEYYKPIAFYYKDKICGGIYAYPWIIGNESSCINLEHFITGTCLFGFSLIGVDKDNKTYYLTDPKLDIPEGSVIEKIKHDSNFHLYEVIMHATLNNLIPFIKSLAGENRPKIAFHLPTIEYFFYGLQLFLKNQITKGALIEYLKIVNLRSNQHLQLLLSTLGEHDISIEISSPLDVLNISKGEPEEIFKSLLRVIKSQTDDPEYIMPSLEEAARHVLEKLKILSVEYCDFWSTAESLNVRPNFIQINNLSYVAKVFVAVRKYQKSEKTINVCLIDNANEKRIAESYKEFRKSGDNLLCIHWLPPLMMNFGQKDRSSHNLFCLNETHSEIISFIGQQVLERAFHTTAKEVQIPGEKSCQ